MGLLTRYGGVGILPAEDRGLTVHGGNTLVRNVGGQLVQSTPWVGTTVVAPGGGSATIQQGPILPGNPAQSVTLSPSTQVNTNRLAEFDLTTLLPAAGSFFEAQLGAVIDMIDGSAVALTFNLIDVLTPDGQVQDIVWLTRPKTVERFIEQIPAGLWRFMNVSGAAIVAGKVVGLKHLAPRNMMVM